MAKTKPVRAPRSTAVLWGWTFVSAILHGVLIGGLCAWSYMGHAKEEAKARAKAEADEAASAKAEAEATKAAAEKPATPPTPGTPEKAPSNQTSAPSSPAPATSNTASTAPTATPAPNILPPPKEPTVPSPSNNEPTSAEKTLGIDKVAKPGETPKSPFAGGTDDLLKDLK